MNDRTDNPVMPRLLSSSSESFWRDLAAAIQTDNLISEEVLTSVSATVNDVRTRGDAGLLAAAAKFDGAENNSVSALPADDLRQAWEDCDEQTRQDFDTTYRRILDYHQRQKPSDLSYTDEYGNRLGWRWLPMQSAGLYIPGGTALYPSSVFMLAVPALVAGVQRVAIASPARSGKVNQLVKAAAYRCGVSEVYPIGGAQAIAALTYGTETIAPVDLIAGPGNKWVTAAKKLVAGDVGIDMLAGPSEVVVIAGAAANPENVALDLLAQAEHDVDARSILISDCDELIAKTCRAVEIQLQSMEREKIARESWLQSGIAIKVETLNDAVAVANYIAPEHLQISTPSPNQLAEGITNAGAIFLGDSTPEVMGDYVAGPSHVLPTARAARFASGVGVHTFLKRASTMEFTPQGASELGKVAQRMAEREELYGHAKSAAIRCKPSK